jgi:glycosyltransferase involved in cell wall biosynthesis
MKISCITVTYGRVSLLERAIDFFLKQDFQEKELVVLNTFPSQKLTGEFPGVRIINLDERPGSLGEARNIAIEEATGDVMVTFDDDDLYLPHHLSVFAERFEGNDWLWATPQFWVLGQEIQSIVRGACPLFSFRKSAWLAVGGYPHLTVGEDAALISKITQQFKGSKVELEPEQITFGYNWGQSGVHHVSGEGSDVPEKMTAHDRAALALQDRVRRNQERTGTIVLHPNSTIDWSFKASAFLERQKKVKTPSA